MNYDPKQFAKMQNKLHEDKENQRRKEREKKARQRERQRAWLLEHYGVSDAETLVRLLMTADPLTIKAYRDLDKESNS